MSDHNPDQDDNLSIRAKHIEAQVKRELEHLRLLQQEMLSPDL